MSAPLNTITDIAHGGTNATTRETAFNNLAPVQTPGVNQYLQSDGTTYFLGELSRGGIGSVTSVSVVSANGVSGSVENPNTTPAITLYLNDISPSSVMIEESPNTGVLLSNSGDGELTIDGDLVVSGNLYVDSFTGNHNLLSNLQGGDAGEYYHLTSAEYSGDWGSKNLQTTGTITGSAVVTTVGNAPGVVIRSNSLSEYASVSLGRTAQDAVVAIAGQDGHFNPIVLSGDMVIRHDNDGTGERKIWIFVKEATDPIPSLIVAQNIGAKPRVGIGVVSPTAGLHLASGHTSSAPLKFNAGSVLVTPQDGAAEWDGVYLYVTSGSTRQAIATDVNTLTFTNKTWNGGTIGIGYGGTNNTTGYNTNALFYYDGSKFVTIGAPSASTNYLVTSAGTTPSYSTTPIVQTSLQAGVAGTTTGALKIAGVTSGVVSLTVNSAAGTWSLTLPNSGGTNNYALVTNGSGTTSWSQISLSAGVTGDLPFANLVQASAASKLIGRGSAAGAGDFQEISLGTGLSMSGTTLSAPGGTSPGGSDTQMQYNNAGSFGGTANLIWDSTNRGVSLGLNTTTIAPIDSQPKYEPASLSTVSTGANPTSIFVQGRYIYVCAKDNNTFDIYANNSEAGIDQVSTYATVDTAPFKCWVAGDYAYVITTASDYCEIIDIRNPAGPVYVTDFACGGDVRDVVVRGKYLYVLERSHIEIWDVSNPAVPQSFSSVALQTGEARAMSIWGNYLYTVGESTNYLECYDLEDPSQPLYISNITTTDSSPKDVWVQGRYAYVVGNANIEIFLISDPTYLYSMGTYSLANAATSISVQGKYCYVGEGGGYEVLNISNPSAVSLYVNVSTDAVQDVFCAGRLLYVVTGNPDLRIWDIGSAHIAQLEAGNIEVANLAVRRNLEADSATFYGGVTVAGTLNVEGGLIKGTYLNIPYFSSNNVLSDSPLSLSAALTTFNVSNFTDPMRVSWGSVGLAAPGTDSQGNKVNLYGGNVAASHSIGVETNFMWFSNDSTSAGTGFKFYAAGATEVFRVAGNSKVGILLSGNPSYELSLGGNAAKTVGMERHTTSNTAGNSLTMGSGGATSGATDKAAGALILQTGIGTGNSSPAKIYVKAPSRSGVSGTTDQTLVDRAVFNNVVALTSGVATTLFAMGAGNNNTMAGGIVDYSVFVSDGTDFIVESGQVVYAVTNKAGAYTSGTSILGTSATAKSDGTDTISTTFSTSSDNFRITCTITGQTPTTFYVIFNIRNNANQSSTPL